MEKECQPMDKEDVVEQALNERALLQIKYQDWQGQETRRLIRPLARDPSGVLEAYCYLRDAIRHFNVSRIQTCTTVDGEAILAEDKEQRLERISDVLASLDWEKNGGRIEFASLGHTRHRVHVDRRRVHQHPICHIHPDEDGPEKLLHRTEELLEENGFSPHRLQREAVLSDLPGIVEWLFRVIFECGTNYRIEAMHVYPGSSDPPWEHTEAAQSGQWQTIRSALERMMQYPMDHALVGFEAVNDWEYDYVQFVPLDDRGGSCMAVKWVAQENALTSESQSLLRQQGFDLQEDPNLPLQATCDVRFDDLEVLADLAHWIFTAVFRLGESYRIEVVNAPWQDARPTREREVQNRAIAQWQAAARDYWEGKPVDGEFENLLKPITRWHDEGKSRKWIANRVREWDTGSLHMDQQILGLLIDDYEYRTQIANLAEALRQAATVVEGASERRPEDMAQLHETLGDLRSQIWEFNRGSRLT